MFLLIYLLFTPNKYNSLAPCKNDISSMLVHRQRFILACNQRYFLQPLFGWFSVLWDKIISLFSFISYTVPCNVGRNAILQFTPHRHHLERPWDNWAMTKFQWHRKTFPFPRVSNDRRLLLSSTIRPPILFHWHNNRRGRRWPSTIRALCWWCLWRCWKR